MSKHQRSRRNSGFTLVEMITVVAVFGLILTLLGLEFVSVVSTTLHTRANTDAESQARIIMSKVETHLRVAYYDYVDNPPGSPVPVASPLPPLPGASPMPTPFVTFYRVSAGGLVGSGTPTLCTVQGVSNVPCPPFELVTIQINPLKLGELDELITPVKSGVQEAPIVLGTNVSSFNILPVSTSRYDVSLTVTEPSSHCVNDQCSFTLNDVVYVGGQE